MSKAAPGIIVKGGNDRYAQPRTEKEFLGTGTYAPQVALVKPPMELTEVDIARIKRYTKAIQHNAEGAVLVLRWQRKSKSGIIHVTQDTIQRENRNVLIGTIINMRSTTENEVDYGIGDIGIFSPYGPFSHVPRYSFIQYLHTNEILSFFKASEKDVVADMYDEWEEPVDYKKLID